MRRRTLVRGVGAGTGAALTGLAGCLTRDDEEVEEVDDGGGEEPDDSALRIATYTSMVTGERSAGRWLEEAFLEERPDAELDWRIPEAGIEHFIRRGEIGAEPGADVYLGLTLGELVRVDEALGGGLFETLDRDRLDHDGRIRDDLTIDDPDDRVLPFDTGYLSLVYDERELEDGPPDSFDALLEPEYERALLAQDPRSSDPGLAFLLWTIAAHDGDGYREYWQALLDNGLRLGESWTDAYRDRYLEGRGSMIVSYSTDRVGAAAAERPLERHQVATLEGAGYRNTEFAAVFAESPRQELAYEFVDFLLSSTAQAELAARNVQFPAVEDAHVDLESSFEEHAREPERTVTTTYDELRGNVGDWLAEWEAVRTGESEE